MIVSPQDDTDSLRPDADVDDVVFFSFAVQFVHGSREPASPAFQGRFHRTSTPGEYQKGESFAVRFSGSSPDPPRF